MSRPVLYCHPLARGPFVEYDEREEMRRERADKVDKEREWDRQKRKEKLIEYQRRVQHEARGHRPIDLRRTVSLNNLRRHATLADGDGTPACDDNGETNDEESAQASGYLASGYMAASGNSVGITSTTGTTSTVGNLLRNVHLPTELKGRLRQQVVTSRRFTIAGTAKDSNTMGPPPTIPDRPGGMLRKSRSTNTMRLPKREEGCKPGYCESCRMRFDDFKVVSTLILLSACSHHSAQHVACKKHRKFALDDSNYRQLDIVLARVRRRTREEAEAAHAQYRVLEEDIEAEDGDVYPTKDPESIQWEDWVEDNDS